MKNKFGLLLLFLVLCTQAFSQVAGTTYTQRISGQKIFNKETGERIGDKELQNLINRNPNIILEPCVNKYGKVESFEVDPNRTSRVMQRDVSMRTPVGEEFPEFVMRTIDNKVLKSEKLRGKNILLQFQLSFAGPFFRETTLQNLSKLIGELKSFSDFESIVVTESSKQEVFNTINVEDYEFNIVADGRNFYQRYLLVNFPELVLVDATGKLMGYYNQTEISKLKTDLKRLTNSN
ncbi:hypothetical protein [uncultured Draconibacterium sp.]|uniref:peroxiredoxin family protein n=1 Tax=uncultured Draconibacterium sp. TaxID=1573823 RepID=UPI0029C9B00C|nr:hypothetical protein [uncultured Draconibacterium sp.]